MERDAGCGGEYKGGVSDQSPVPSSDAPQHPAPPAGWVPLSGLALTSFILSVVLVVVALLGLWIVELVPLVLGAYTLTTFKTGKQRGRMLAVWAIVISISAGSCAFVSHQSLRTVFSGISESLLSALSSKETDENRDAALKPWVAPAALEKNPDLLKQWRERYAGVADAYGAWSGTLDLPTPILGGTLLFVAPDGVTEVGTGEEPPKTWMRGAVVWTPAVFERGTVYVAVVFLEGDQEALRGVQDKLQPGTQAPIVGDLRFFEKQAETGE